MIVGAYEPEKPVVIVNKDYYMELKHKAQLNDVELKKKATEMANEIMIKDGIDFTIRINDEQSIIKGNEVVEIEDEEYSDWASWDPKIKKMKYSIANDLIRGINKVFNPQRENIIKFFQECYKEREKWYKRTIIRLIFSTCILGMAFLGTLIYAIIK